MCVASLPAEAIGFVVANDEASVLADDDAARLLNQHTVALVHLVSGAAHVIETPRIILRRGRHEDALRLRRGRPGWRSRRLQGRGGDGGRSDRLLWRDRLCRLAGSAGAALKLLLRVWRSSGRLRAGKSW